MNAPHRTWAVTWTLWFAGVLVALAMPDRPIVGLWVLLAFLPLEAGGVFFGRPNTRDTLSEIMTWVQRHLSKHQEVARGWNALVLMIVVTIAYLLGRVVWDYSGSILLASVMGGLCVVLLNDHWLSPQTHG